MRFIFAGIFPSSMSVRNHFQFLSAIFLLFISEISFAQKPPIEDPNAWILDTEKSDEFNGTALDTSKWWAINPCNFTDSIHHGYNWGSGDHFRPQNVSVSNGNVILTVDFNSDSLNDSIPCIHHHLYRFYSGGIQTKQTMDPDYGIIGTYTYGYFEMKAKLPGYYNAMHQSVGTGFWPTFWFYYEHVKDSCNQKQDEVDILEPDGKQYYDARTNVVGLHDENGMCVSHKVAQDSMTSATPLFEDYHKYAVESFPDKLIFYFDDQPFFSIDTITSPQYVHALNFPPYLAVVMAPVVSDSPYPLSETPFPQFMTVDYFRYYRLKSDSQNTVLQNYPNPFKNTTQIIYNVLNASAQAFINVYDITGREIKSVYIAEKGKSKITLDCTDLKSGVYFYRLSVDNMIVDTKKMIVVK